MTLGHVTHAAREGVHVFRYFGTVDFTLAPGLQRFVQGLLVAGRVSGLVFDLSAAESLDSTNLGLMARVNEQARDAGAANSVIISSNEDIDAVLRSMGFEQSFEFFPAGCDAPDASAEPVTAEALSAPELQRTMLDAHRALVRLSEAGRIEFEQVVACLERDAAQSQA
jgi:anti-anti-sigma factor